MRTNWQTDGQKCQTNMQSHTLKWPTVFYLSPEGHCDGIFHKSPQRYRHSISQCHRPLTLGNGSKFQAMAGQFTGAVMGRLRNRSRLTHWLQGMGAWWRHQMETFAALLALCAGTSSVTGQFSSQRPVTRSLGVFIWSAPWINVWVNNRDLRRHHAHYDAIKMK